MSDENRIQEEAVSLDDNNTVADNLRNNDGASETDSDNKNLEPHWMCSMILSTNRFNAIHISSSNRLAKLSSSTKYPTPFRLLDLPSEIRIMIYRLALGNRYLHIYSNCTTIPDKIVQCNDEDPHTCLESKLNKDRPGFPMDSQRDQARHRGLSDEVVHCQGSVLFHNRICTSRGINVGDSNGYWSLSLSQEVQTGMKTIEHGTRDTTNSADAKPLDYCPCIQRTKTSLSLNLLQTCKQIHAEAALIPYESNTFIFQEVETFAAFFGLVFPKQSDSNDNPTFASDRSNAIYNMRNVRLHSRAMTSQHLLYVTRLLRAGLSLLAGLQTLELTLGVLPFRRPEWEIDDSLFGVSRSVKKVTVNIRDCIHMAREHHVPANRLLTAAMYLNGGAKVTTMKEKQVFAKKLIEWMLKKDGFQNEEVRFLGPVLSPQKRAVLR